MSYIESFKAVMDEARILMADCYMPFLDRLQAAHDAEMKQLSKEEFHRGYESGVAARDAEQWQLDRERAKIIEAVRKVVPEGYFGSDEMLSEICRAIYSPVFGWTAEAGRYLCDRLIYLLGGKSINSDAEASAKVVQNGEKYQLATYDVLGNERHKAVCELRNARDSMSGSMADNVSRIMYAIDARPEVGERVCKAIADRLIHLLDGSEYGLSNRIDGSGSRMGDSMGDSEHCEDTCDGGCERLTALDNGTCPNDDVTCPNNGTPSSITSELRKFAETFRYEWYDVKYGSSCYTTSDCPPSLDSVNMTDYINGIADRIDAQFERICSQHEAVLQQTVIETVDEHEREMAELRAKLSEYESCDLAQTHRTLKRMLGEVKNLHDTLKARADAKPRITKERDGYRKLAKRNEQWCDALLDLIRDASADYEAEHMECVELRQKLSARDAIIDSYHERMKGLDETERRMAVAESKCEELSKMLIMQDYVRGVIDQEEAGRRIERLRDARY